MRDRMMDQAIDSTLRSFRRLSMNRLFVCCGDAIRFDGCRLVLAAAFAVLLLSSHARAAVFERDWQTPGDGLLTYDDVNRREWLDLTVSLLDQFPEPRLENAVAEIGPGGLFEGFTWARRNDVMSLAQSAGIDTSTVSPISQNEIPVMELMELLGLTIQVNQPLQFLRSMGHIDELDPLGRPDVGILLLNRNPMSGQVGLAGLYFSAGDDLIRPDTTGVFLYRNVPEPPVCYIVILLLYCASTPAAGRFGRGSGR
jgi:hypothetical protein